MMRRVPLLGATLPPPQHISLTHPGTYRLRVHLASRSCNFSPCIAAILMDAAPMTGTTAELPDE